MGFDFFLVLFLCGHDVGWFCLSPPSVAVSVEVAGCQGVVCASGQLASLWRAFSVACGQLCLASHLTGLWGFSVALSSASLNAHADGWRCPA